MPPKTTVHLFGPLHKTTGSWSKGGLNLMLENPTPLIQIIKDLEIAEERVQLAMVNHRAVPKDTLVFPGDRLALFPSEYPIIADWKNLRP